MPGSKREGIFNVMRYIEKFTNLIDTQSILEFFCLGLNSGSLDYFLKFRRNLNKSGKLIFPSNSLDKKFETSMFYLIDSEISLRTGNTEEFYNEFLEFLLMNFSDLRLETVCHLLYKVIMVVALETAAYSEKREVTLIEGDYQKLKYYSKCNVEDLQLNKIEKDQDYSLLKEVYDMVIEKFENSYFPEVESILNRIEFIIQKNGLFDIDIDDLGLSFKNERTTEVITINYSLDDNYQDYSKTVAAIQRERASLEYAHQAVRRAVNSNFQKMKKAKKDTKKDQAKDSLALINYDYILWMDALSNKETLSLFEEENFCKMFQNNLQPFILSINEEFYINKKKAIETLLPFIIDFNNELMELITTEYENFELKILSANKFLSVKKFKLKMIKKQKHKIKIFKDEDEFYESQRMLMKKMLLGYKISQDLNKTKKLIKKEKEKRLRLKDIMKSKN